MWILAFKQVTTLYYGVLTYSLLDRAELTMYIVKGILQLCLIINYHAFQTLKPREGTVLHDTNELMVKGPQFDLSTYCNILNLLQGSFHCGNISFYLVNFLIALHLDPFNGQVDFSKVG